MDEIILDTFVSRVIQGREALDDASISRVVQELIDNLSREGDSLSVIEPASIKDDSVMLGQLIRGFKEVLDQTRQQYQARLDEQVRYTREVEKTSKLVGRQNLVLSYFYQASQMLSSSLDAATIISMIVDMLSNIFDSCICVLYSIDEDGRLMISHRIRPSIEEFSDYFNGNITMHVGQGCEGMCINEQIPFQIYDVYNSPFYRGFTDLARRFNFQSVLSVPLIVRDNVEGCISIYDERQKHFPEEEVRILSLFSDQAALAIENARLYQQTDQKLKQRVMELSLVHRVDLCIINNEEIRNMGEIILSGLEETFPGCAFALDLTGLNPGWWLSDSQLSGLGIQRTHLDPVASEAMDRNDMIPGFFRTSQGVVHYICFPVGHQSEAVGAFFMASGDPDELEGEVARFIQGIISQLSIAIEKTRTLDQLIHAEKMNVLGSLMSGIAHEINGPLSRILGISESFREEKDVDEVMKYFDLIIEESLRCKRIIEDFLAFARKYKSEHVLSNINDVIIKTLQLWKYQKKTDDMIIRTEFANNLPRVNINCNRIEQVFLNLIVNAYHALTDVDRTPKVLMIKSQFYDGKVRVVFQDNGPGIPEECRDRIFQPFFTTKPTGQGTGLGLSLSRDIIREHGGEITVGDTPGHGAKFIIDLVPDLSSSDSGPVSIAGSIADLDSIKILIADDDLLILKLMGKFLKKEGHVIESVRNGADCLERIRQSTYDLVISDMIMPDLRGDQLIDILMEEKPEVLKRLILCTGDILDREKLEYFESAGVHLLYKPFEMKELKKKIMQVFGSPLT